MERGNILWNLEAVQITDIIDLCDMEISHPARDFAGLYYEYGERFGGSVLSKYASNYDSVRERYIFYEKLIPDSDAMRLKRNVDMKEYGSSLEKVKCLSV